MSRHELEAVDSLIEAVAQLDPKQRYAVEVRFYDGRKNHEIAEQLGLTPKQASALLGRALRRLKVMLGRTDSTKI